MRVSPQPVAFAKVEEEVADEGLVVMPLRPTPRPHRLAGQADTIMRPLDTVARRTAKVHQEVVGCQVNCCMVTLLHQHGLGCKECVPAIFIKDATGAVIYQQPAPPSLYAFTGITFNSCGIYGRLGPELSFCTSSYRQYGAWTSNTAFFNVSNGIQAWTVPATGKYRQSPITLLKHTIACPGAAACMHASADITP